MLRGQQDYAPDHDTEITRGQDDDDQPWGECETCGAEWDQDGPRCECETRKGEFMGQQVQAVVYGVYEDSRHSKLRDDDLDDWIDPPSAVGRIETGEGGRRVIGIAVAVANVPDEGEVDFPECPVAALGGILAQPMVAAKRRWAALAKWAKALGVELGVPELLLVPVERA